MYRGWRFLLLALILIVLPVDALAEATWGSDDGAVHYERRARLLSHEISANDYASFREGVLQVRSEDRQAIVLVPK
jgi:hypothetical protein